VTGRSAIEAIEGRFAGTRPTSEKKPSTTSAATTIDTNITATSSAANRAP